MKTLIAIVALVSTTFVAGQALASETTSCTSAPKSSWMTKGALKSKYEGMGYKVRRVKVEGSCYEIYALDKNKKRVEAALNPVDGSIVNGAESD